MLSRIKNHYSYSILDNGISSFHHSFSNSADRRPYHLTLSEHSSSSITDPNYLRNHESHLDTLIETETKVLPKPPFTKRILLLDDDPDITLTFKAGLDGRYYDHGDKKKRFEVYPYNDPLFVIK
ncbi:MAG TPA: hypothetical protein VH796_14170, partial [Nitrososphaeraceae archaeon]